MANLDLGDGSPTSVLSGATNFFSEGGNIGTAINGMVLGLVASVYIGFTTVLNALVDLIVAPLASFGEELAVLIAGLLPGEILSVTQSTSATQISVQFGWLAFPVGVGMVLVTLMMVTIYRNEDETGDLIPGLPFDAQDVTFGLLGTEEEAEPDD